MGQHSKLGSFRLTAASETRSGFPKSLSIIGDKVQGILHLLEPSGELITAALMQPETGNQFHPTAFEWCLLEDRVRQYLDYEIHRRPMQLTQVYEPATQSKRMEFDGPHKRLLCDPIDGKYYVLLLDDKWYAVATGREAHPPSLPMQVEEPPTEERNYGMKKSHIIFLLDETVKCVEVIYATGEKPQLAKTRIPDLKKDDLVVIESGTRHGMTVAKVERVGVEPNLDGDPEMGWIVQRVNTEAHADLIERENFAVGKVQEAERRRKREELRKSMLGDQADNAAELLAPPDEA